MMEKLRRHRPSHAIAVAYLALFVALGGTGYAASKVGSREIKDNSIRSRDVKNGSLQRRDFARAAQAATGAGGVNGSAWGLVSPGGQLSRSHNASSVSRVGPGIYCIALSSQIDPTTRGVVATPDYSNDATRFNNSTSDRQAVVEWASAGSCPSGRLEIQTGIRYPDGRIQRADQGFFFSVPGAGGLDVEYVTRLSDGNSRSGKNVEVGCPAGKLVIGGVGAIFGGKTGVETFDELTDIALDRVDFTGAQVNVSAIEEEPTNKDWRIQVKAACADFSP